MGIYVSQRPIVDLIPYKYIFAVSMLLYIFSQNMAESLYYTSFLLTDPKILKKIVSLRCQNSSFATTYHHLKKYYLHCKYKHYLRTK